MLLAKYANERGTRRRSRPRRTRVAVIAVVSGLALGALPAATGASAAVRVAHPAVDGAPGVTAYAYANRPTSRSYTPESDYSYNSTGASNHITRSALGEYTVQFTGLGAYALQGTVDVTAEGLQPAECEVVSWGPDSTGANLLVNVDCFEVTGPRLNAYYEVAFTSGGSTSGTTDYVWANQPGAASYTPALAYQFNSSGGTNTITKIGTGEYQVTMPGPVVVDGSVKVTAYGTVADSCQVAGWFDESSGQDVDVDCFSKVGAPVNDKFTMTFTASNDLMGDGGPSGYLWANEPTASSYTPDLSYQYDSGGGEATVDNLGETGEWENIWPNDGQGDSGDQQATAYGATDAHCIVDGPAGGTGPGSQQTGDVFCFDTSGNPLNTYYTTQWWAR